MGRPLNERATAIRGLATVALLRVNFDTGHDHIAMFEPFLLDAIQQFDRNGYDIEQVRESLAKRSGLSVPINTLRTLMHRIVRRGFATREGGRYFPSNKPLPIEDLLARRSEVEHRQNLLAEALCTYGQKKKFVFESIEDALAGMLEFIDHFHVTIALGDALVENGESRSEWTHRESVIAGFLQDQLVGDGASAALIQETLEGYVLQNALLLKDISSASRHFDNLDVYLDTSLLLGLLGFRGDAQRIATSEFVQLLRAAGGIPMAFDATLRELRSILAVYEDKLCTNEGRMSLHPTDVTRYFITHH